MRALSPLRALPLLLLLVGCPDPPAPPPGPGGPPGPQQGGGQGAPDGAATPDGGPGQGGGQGGGPQGAPAGDRPADWKIIPQAVLDKEIYPTLQLAATWPDPSGLAPAKDLPAEKQPSESEVRSLEELVSRVVREDLRPSDPQAALGVDAAGRLYMKLGRSSTKGSASLHVPGQGGEAFPVFALTLESDKPPQDLDALLERVKRVVSRELAEELDALPKNRRLQAHPQVNGGGHVAGLAMLDQQGFGLQFPYLYAYANDGHVLVVLQEVPHRTAPPGD